MARRWSNVQSQILVWAGTERLDIMYDAEAISIPPRDEIARIGPRSPYRYESAMTRGGSYIPGTLLLRDIIKDTEEGGVKKTFDVGDFCTFLENARRDLFDRGLEIITDPEDAGPVLNELIPKWEASQDRRAQEIVATELARRKKLEEKGNPITPGSSEHLVVWAFHHLKNRQAAALKPAIDTSDLFNVASGQYNASPRPAAASGPISPDRATAYNLAQEAEAAGVNLNKGELRGLLAGDPETIGFVREKLALKKDESPTGA